MEDLEKLRLRDKREVKKGEKMRGDGKKNEHRAYKEKHENEKVMEEEFVKKLRYRFVDEVEKGRTTNTVKYPNGTKTHSQSFD